MAEHNKQAFNASRFGGFNFDPSEVLIVGLDVEPNEETQHLYDPRCHDEIDDAMVLNVMTYGVIEPIVVTKIGTECYVVDGRGRLKASREANRRLKAEGKEELRVPSVLRRGADHELFGVSVSANEIRRDDNPMVKAEKVSRYISMGRTVAEAAITFGVSEVAIGQWLKLLGLAKPVQRMVKEGKLSSHAASKLDTLPAEKQVEMAKNAIASAKAGGKKATGKNMQEATGGTPTAPPKRLVQKIIRLTEKPALKPEHDNFWSALRFMLGNLSAEEVGLDTTVAEIEKANSEAKDAADAEKSERKAKRQAKEAKKAKAAAERKAKAAKKAKAAEAAAEADAEKSASPPGPRIAKKKPAKGTPPVVEPVSEPVAEPAPAE